jgi:hypothetical protein
VEGLFRGLQEWESGGLFINLYHGWLTFLGQEGSGIRIRWVNNNDWGVKRVEDIPQTVHVWLVRSGPHSAQRFTQEEMDAVREDAYNQGLRDAGDSRAVFSIDTGTLFIPAISGPGPLGGTKVYEANLESVPATAPPLFSLTNVQEITDQIPQSD